MNSRRTPPRSTDRRLGRLLRLGLAQEEGVGIWCMNLSAIPLITALVLVLTQASGCSAPDSEAEAGSNAGTPTPDLGASSAAVPLLPSLLTEDRVVFGSFPGPTTPDQGATLGANRELDFVFYSLESGPFDLVTAQEYMAGIAEGSGAAQPHPLLLRVPPIGDDPEAARRKVAMALEAGVSGIVFPHVESAQDAEIAVDAMGNDLWPGNPEGGLLAVLIIEDKAGIERVEQIVATPGVSVVFAGPGDLRRAYEGDMEVVEAAIQSVLAACGKYDMPCGITAGVEDIAGRIAEGFSVFIVGDPAAVTAGRAAAEVSTPGSLPRQ